jgi:ATP-dependent DNA helicase RecQ
VRQDIAEQLRLQSPEILVGSFDRPNLHYRVVRRKDLRAQVHDVLGRHKDESGIIYCISRKEVDTVAADLVQCGFRAVAYHAGLSDEARHTHQDQFVNDKADIVVATVAFGMGVDKPDVRFVMHCGSPKSLEHYQQETGRAGRDGLPAECVMFYTSNDFSIWQKLQSELTGEAAQQMRASLGLMERYCSAMSCRHRALVEHFGQTYDRENCAACDACLDQLELAPEPLILGQKILSCVVRCGERFGGQYVAQVLHGSQEARIRENRHDKLSTYGLLKEHRVTAIRDWIEQLVGLGCLELQGEYRALVVTPLGRELLRGQWTPRLLVPASRRSAAVVGLGQDAQPFDHGLFEHLRRLRREIADNKGIAPFMVFGDVTLRDLARRRPTTTDGFRATHGIGDKKASDYSAAFLIAIADYCAAQELATDVLLAEVDESEEPTVRSLSQAAADDCFRRGMSVEDVASRMNRALSTTWGYLGDFLRHERRTSAEPWVNRATYDRIVAFAANAPDNRMKTIYDHFEGTISYDLIRISLTCWHNTKVTQG